MDQIEKRIKEIEKRNKKSNKMNLLVGLIILLGLASFYFYSAHIRAIKDRQIMQKKQQLEIVELEKKNEELRAKIAERQVDSIQKYAVYSANEVKEGLSEIRRSTNDSRILKSVDSIENKVNKITKIASDTVAIRYYKRKKDGDVVEKVISNIESPHYVIDTIVNVRDNNRVNTMYYGNLIRKEYVDALALRLKKSGLDIVNVKPFHSEKGYDWKKFTVQIEFEKPKDAEVANSDLHIRMYSYQPNEKIKYAIEKELTQKGFQVKVFPNWDKKQSFFSNQSTVLYYHSSNKDKAISIARALTGITKKMSGSKDRNRAWKVSMGSGLGVDKDEKKELFIIHYNGG